MGLIPLAFSMSLCAGDNGWLFAHFNFRTNPCNTQDSLQNGSIISQKPHQVVLHMTFKHNIHLMHMTDIGRTSSCSAKPMPATSDTRLPKPADAKVEKPSFTPSVASISSPATSCSQKRQLQNSIVEALLISSAEHRKCC